MPVDATFKVLNVLAFGNVAFTGVTTPPVAAMLAAVRLNGLPATTPPLPAVAITDTGPPAGVLTPAVPRSKPLPAMARNCEVYVFATGVHVIVCVGTGPPTTMPVKIGFGPAGVVNCAEPTVTIELSAGVLSVRLYVPAAGTGTS